MGGTMTNRSMLVLGAMVLAGGFALAQQREQRPPDPRSMGGGDCRGQPVQLRRRAESLARGQHRVARGNDLDGRARRDEGGQDHRHCRHRRHRAERSVAGARQAQLRAARQLRGHRAQDGERAVRADRQARARGRLSTPRPSTWRAPARCRCARTRSARCSRTSRAA